MKFYDKNPNKEVAWLFIDAEKSFDNINWEFMLNVMNKLELGPKITKALQVIYKNQATAFKVNNDTSTYFEISKGTRQGCPLSPLLFIMVIEFLLIKIREYENIRGLRYKGFHYKTRAFPDDLVFILEDPLSTIPKVIQAIHEFGQLAGFYLNLNKSKQLLKKYIKKPDR